MVTGRSSELPVAIHDSVESVGDRKDRAVAELLAYRTLNEVVHF